MLARHLATTFPEVWVNNGGIDGHSTFGHLTLLKSFVIRLRPKVALFLVGANDVGLELPTTFDDGLRTPLGGVRVMANTIAQHSEVVTMSWNLARAFRARNRGLGHSELDLTTAEQLHLDDQVIAETIERFRGYLPGYTQRLVEIATVTRSAGIEPVWLTQPALFGEGVDPATGTTR